MVGANSVSLGTLRLNLTVGYRDFIAGLQQANKALLDFKKNLVISRTAGGKALRYGIFTKSFFANVDQANNALTQVRENLEKIAKLAAKVAATGIKVPTEQPITAKTIAETTMKKEGMIRAPSGKLFKTTYTNIIAAQRAAKLLDEEFSKLGYNVPISLRPVADATGKVAIVVGGLKKVTKETTWDVIKNLASFQSFFAKIIHYITFSIGVQLIMGIKNAVSNFISTISEFQSAAINAATVSGYLYSSFDKVVSQIINMSRAISRRSIFSVQEVAKAFYSLASAGYDVNAMTKDVSKGLKQLMPIINYATATQIDLDFAVQSVAKTLKQFRMELDDSQKVVDAFTTVITNTFATAQKLAEGFKYTGSIAGVLRQDIDEVAAALGILYDRGLEGGQAGQRLNMIFTKLLKPTDKAVKMLDSLGLTVSDLNPRIYSLTDILYKLQAAHFDAAQAAMMFRARTAGTAVMLVEAADEVANLAAQVKMSGGITEKVASAQMQSFENQMKLLRNRTTDASLELMNSFLPALTGIVKFINESVVPGMKSFYSVLGSVVSALSFFAPILSGVAKAAVGIAPAIFMAYTSLALFTKLIPATTLSMLEAEGAFTSLGATIKSSLPLLVVLATSWSIIADAAGPFKDIIHNITPFILVAVVAMKYLNKEMIAAAANTITNIISFKALKNALIGVTAAAEGASVALKGLLITSIIGAVIIGLMELVMNWDKVVGAISSFLGISKKTVPMTKDMKDAIKDYNTTSIDYLRTSKELVSTQEEIINTENKLAELRKEGKTSTDEYIQTTQKLTELYSKLKGIQLEYKDAQEKTLDSTSRIIVAIRSLGSDTLDQLIVKTGEVIETEYKRQDLNKELTQLQEDRIKAENDLNKAIEIYGANSKEVTDARNKLYEIELKISDNEKESLDIEEKLAEAQDEQSKLLKKLNPEYKDYYELGKRILESRARILNFEKEYAKLHSQELILKRHLVNTDKLYKERLKDVWEQQLKVYEAELKLYKLQKDKPKVIEDLFDALAKYGLLNEEIIDQYKELELAEAEEFKARMKFFNVMSKLSASQREDVENLIKVYQEFLDEGLDPITAWSRAISTTGIDLSSFGLSDEDIQIIEEYGYAEWNVTRITKEFGDALESLLGPLGDLQNMDLPSEVKDALTEWLKLFPEVKKAEEGLDDETKKLNDTWQGLIDIAVYTWRALQDTADESIVQTWGEMVQQNEALSEAIRASGGSLELLRKLFPEETTNAENLSSALESIGENGVVAATAMLEFAKNLGIPLDDIDSMESLLSSISDISGITNLNWSEISKYSSDMLESTPKLESVMENIANIMDRMASSLYTITTLTKIQAAGGFEEWHKDVSLLFKGWAEGIGRLQHISFEDYINTSQSKKDISSFIQWLYETFPTDIATQYSLDLSNTFSNLTDYESDISSFQEWLLSNPGKWDVVIKETMTSKQFKEKWQNDIQGLNEWADKQQLPINLKIYIGENNEWVDAQSSFGPIIDDINNYVLDHPIKVPIKFVPESKKTKTLSLWEQIYAGLFTSGPSSVVKSLIDNIILGGFPFAQEGLMVKKPTYALIGEAGPEAVVPLSGKNRKYGESILNYIIPKYFPELTMQTGGIVNPIPITKPTLSITRIVQDIYDLLRSGVKVILESSNLPTTPTSAPITPPAPGVPVPVYTPTTGPSTGTSQGGLFSSTVEVRQGGKKINVEIYIDANLFNNSIQSFIDSVNNFIPQLDSSISNLQNSFNSFYSVIVLFGSEINSFYTTIKSAASVFYKAVKAVTPIEVHHSVTVRHEYSFPRLPGHQKGGLITKPIYSLIGEAGPEAIIPLSGINKKYGEKILNYIIPKYFPEMTFQTGGIYEGSKIINENYEEKYNVLGPVYVTANNVEEFSKDLKYRYRMSGGR